ncbi:Pycsar system effector family protein [Streptomyces sp. NPDC056987]|uniref:Pycsar system effector family protein n=1 Tax=Streptomyces sp. NPDC056987 TaxID=3345988 RepID=UPI00362EDBB4
MSAAPDTQLDAQIAQIVAEIARTDTKGGTLLAALALPLAILVDKVPGGHLTTVGTILVSVGTIGLIGAVLLVLLVILPRISGAPRGSYLYWAHCTPEQLVEDLRSSHRAEQIIRLSKIATTKYTLLRRAIFLTAGAFIALAAAIGAVR